MICVVVGNARSPSPQKLRAAAEKADLVIAVDGGARFCTELSITPDLVLGDMDSISGDLLNDLQKRTKIYKFQKDKDHTDLKLALIEAERLGAKKIQVFCWADERLDYSLATLIDSLEIKAFVEFMGVTSDVFVLSAANKILKLKEVKGTKVSIFSLMTPVSLKTSGFKWKFELKKEKRPIFSQSNEIVSGAVIKLSEGAAFVLVEKP